MVIILIHVGISFVNNARQLLLFYVTKMVEWELEGCFQDVTADLTVKIERCGCNSAFGNYGISTALLSIPLFIMCWFLF
jgi:hypothetical protein